MMLLEVPDLGNVKIGAACGIAPTLRTEREEWGTHFFGSVRVIERLGHPPNTITTSGANCWGEAYTIDPWGNLTNRAGVSGMGGCSTELLSQVPNTKNQLPGICAANCYD